MTGATTTARLRASAGRPEAAGRPGAAGRDAAADPSYDGGRRPMLAIRGLDVDLGGRRVLDGIDLDLHAGQLVGLLGPNGAGKTTLMRALLGLVRAQAGQILVDGDERIERRRALCGYVPQRHDVAWSFPMTVHEAVLGGRVARIGWLRRAGRPDYAAAATALRRVRMDHLADRPIGELSGGQRQRVLIARALADEPRVLLLDEPFTGLDMPTQEILADLFAELAADGESLLMSTHDLPGAAATCDRLVLLRGRVLADGTPEQLRDAAVWADTFEVRPDSPLLAGLGLESPGPAVAPGVPPAATPAPSGHDRTEPTC